MYVELSRFESSLSTLDQLTFCKRMGEEMDRRVNRIVKVVNQDYPDFRMQLTYTHNFFYLKETQSMFGSEELPRTPTIE